METLFDFASDNHVGAHPLILEAIINCNNGEVPSYGDDKYTQKAIKLIQEVFESNAGVFFTVNGTAANVLSLASCCNSYHAVLCSSSAHIHTDECGALERFVGCKILAIETEDGKLTPQHVETYLLRKGNVHHNQPIVISISQPTEWGTVYTAEEIKELCIYAHKNDMYLHVDGARIANATVSLALPISQIITNAGVDIISFGGTKNGMLFGEAVVVLNKKLLPSMPFIQKQSMQLISKMRYIGAQFIAYFTDDLWLKNAHHANQMTRLMEKLLLDLPQITIAQKVQVNSIFAFIPHTLFYPLQECAHFYQWEIGNNKNEIPHNILVR